MGSYDHGIVSRFVKNNFPVSIDKISNAIETGTWIGEGAKSLAHNYDKVYTIELDPIYYQQCLKRFERVDEDICYSKIICLHGNSADVFKSLLPTLSGPSTFWLDAHFMGNNKTDWKNSIWNGYCQELGKEIDHSGCINNDPSKSQNQVPLDVELELIYNLHDAPAIVYIDDIDKFTDEGMGEKNKMFLGEDWSHLNLNQMIDKLSPRILAMEKCGYGQLIISLKEK